MGTQIAQTSETFGKASDKSWLRTRMGLQDMMPITLDISAFDAEHIVNGYIPSGIVLGKITAGGKYGPYNGQTGEVQSVVATGGTAGTFTFSFGGETTAAINWNATAAQIQAALETLAAINPGDVACSGGPLPTTAVTITWAGQYLGQDVPALSVTDTITNGDAVLTTSTAGGGGGGAGGLDIARGHLFEEVKVTALTDADCGAALYWTGVVRASKLPSFTGTGDGIGELDALARQQLASWIRYE